MSNELKVTSGEWSVSDEHECHLLRSSDGDLIAIVESGKEDAHLLAASKKLYEALLLIEPDGDFTIWENKDGEDIGEKINAALAAARGEVQ